MYAYLYILYFKSAKVLKCSTYCAYFSKIIIHLFLLLNSRNVLTFCFFFLMAEQLLLLCLINIYDIYNNTRRVYKPSQPT